MSTKNKARTKKLGSVIEIIDRLKNFSRIAKVFPLLLARGLHRTWNTAFKGQLKLVNDSVFKRNMYACVLFFLFCFLKHASLHDV
jgi:hypothetical protein